MDKPAEQPPAAIVSPLWVVRNRRAVSGDLKRFVTQADHRHKLLFGALAVLIPVLLVAGFAHDSKVAPPGPQMYFLPSWPTTRSDAEIVRQQKIDQAAAAKAAAEKRRGYRELERKLGM